MYPLPHPLNRILCSLSFHSPLTNHIIDKMACCGGAISSDMRATVTEVPATSNATGPGYEIQGYEDLKYTYSFVDNVFDQKKEDLAAYYQKWGRVLCVLDENLNELYGPSIKACKYFFL